MRLPGRPRPWSIHLFAALLFVTGLWQLIGGLLDIEAAALRFSGYWPYLEWTEDLTIIALSARFTIVLIPIVAMWVFASWIVRVFVGIAGIFASWTIAKAAYSWFADEPIDHVILLPAIATIVAAALLFTRSADGWIRQMEYPDPATFE